MFTAFGDCSNLRSLVFATSSILVLTGAPLGYSVVFLCHGGSVTLGLQDQFFHVLQKIKEGVDDGIGQAIDLFLVCTVADLASPPSVPHSQYQGEVYIKTLISSPCVVLLFSCPETGLPTPTPLLCCLSKV